MTRIILASSSPRRHQLLKKFGIDHDVIKPEYQEPPPQENEDPVAYARDIAVEKVKSIEKPEADCLVIGADTIVVFQGRIMGKPGCETEAKNMISLLSGQQHYVITGLALGLPDGLLQSCTVQTEVTFRELSRDEIDWYIESHDWKGKAGAYGIQSLGGALVEKISGDWFNVVGLPMPQLLIWLSSSNPGIWPPSIHYSK